MAGEGAFKKFICQVVSCFLLVQGSSRAALMPTLNTPPMAYNDNPEYEGLRKLPTLLSQQLDEESQFSITRNSSALREPKLVPPNLNLSPFHDHQKRKNSKQPSPGLPITLLKHPPIKTSTNESRIESVQPHLSFWVQLPGQESTAVTSKDEHKIVKRSMDSLGRGSMFNRALDSIGHGSMFNRGLDSIGGGSMFNRALKTSPKNAENFIDNVAKEFPPTGHSESYAKQGSLDSFGMGDSMERKSLDSLGKGSMFNRGLDSIGRGSVFNRALDSIGRGSMFNRALDSIGRGGLLEKKALDSIDRGSKFNRALDSIGRGYLLEKKALESLGRGSMFNRALDSIGSSTIFDRRSNPFDQEKMFDGASGAPEEGFSNEDKLSHSRTKKASRMKRKSLDSLGRGYIFTREIKDDKVFSEHDSQGEDSRRNEEDSDDEVHQERNNDQSNDRLMNPRGLDSLGRGDMFVRGLDSSSQGQALYRSLDSLGRGGMFVRGLDSLGRDGGVFSRGLDSLGRGDMFTRGIDSIGRGHLFSRSLDPFGRGELLPERNNQDELKKAPNVTPKKYHFPAVFGEPDPRKVAVRVKAHSVPAHGEYPLQGFWQKNADENNAPREIPFDPSNQPTDGKAVAHCISRAKRSTGGQIEAHSGKGILNGDPLHRLDRSLTYAASDESKGADYGDSGSKLSESEIAGRSLEPRTLDSLGNGEIMNGRDLQGLEADAAEASLRRGNLMKRLDVLSGMTIGAQKRNFDEIGHGMMGFAKKNFDEIGHGGMGFAKKNFDEIGHGMMGFAKKNFDEIGHGSMGFAKKSRASDEDNRARLLNDLERGILHYLQQKRNFDEIGHGMMGFAKKNFDEIGHGAMGFAKKNFDEIGHGGMGFAKKNFDEIGHGMMGFAKKNFDEIGHGRMGFAKKNFDEIGHGGMGFAKKNFDEIGHSSMGFLKKRSVDPKDKPQVSVQNP